MKRKSKVYFRSTESWHFAVSQCSRYFRKSSLRSKAELIFSKLCRGISPLKDKRIVRYELSAMK